MCLLGGLRGVPSRLDIGLVMMLGGIVAVVAIVGEGRGSILSSPSRLNRSTSSFADCTNLNSVVGLEVTDGKFWLPIPPPPMERISFSCGYWLFNCVNALIQPCVPSTGICSSAHSSLSFGGREYILALFLYHLKEETNIDSPIWFNPVLWKKI